MAIVLTIASLDKTSLIDWRSLKREEVLTREANKLSFSIKKFGTQTYKPTISDEVILTIGGVREFGGIVTEIQESIEGRVEYIEVVCKDYTHTLDRYLVSKIYENMSVNAIIADILTTFTDGTFTGSNVSCATVIDKVQFNYLPVSKALEKITGLVSGTDWYVDYNKDIYFFFTSTSSATFNLTDTSNNYVFESLNLTQDNSQLRNQITVRGGITTSTTSRTELLTGDGGKYIFPLATKFALTPTITVGGVSKTVGIENVDTAGFDVYWNYTEKTLKFIVAPASATNNIEVTGVYEYPLIVQKSDELSISTYGIYEFVIVDKSIRDSQTAIDRATVDLLKYAQPIYSLTFSTYTYGLKTGQTINIQSTIRSINKNVKIQNIRSRLNAPNQDTMRHDIEAITTEDLGINDILTRLLLNNQSDELAVTEDEYISRIRGISDSISITDSTPTNAKTSPPYTWDNFSWGFATWN
jgi:hypothetical protein